MISQEIKLYDEPVWKAQTVITPAYKPSYLPYHPYTDVPKVTQKELEEETAEAVALGVKVGSKFRYKSNKHNSITIIGWETNPKEAALFGTRIGVALGKRDNDGTIYHYSIDELFGEYMEEVTA